MQGSYFLNVTKYLLRQRTIRCENAEGGWWGGGRPPSSLRKLVKHVFMHRNDVWGQVQPVCLCVCVCVYMGYVCVLNVCVVILMAIFSTFYTHTNRRHLFPLKQITLHTQARRTAHLPFPLYHQCDLQVGGIWHWRLWSLTSLLLLTISSRSILKASYGTLPRRHHGINTSSGSVSAPAEQTVLTCT